MRSPQTRPNKLLSWRWTTRLLQLVWPLSTLRGLVWDCRDRCLPHVDWYEIVVLGLLVSQVTRSAQECEQNIGFKLSLVVCWPDLSNELNYKFESWLMKKLNGFAFLIQHSVVVLSLLTTAGSMATELTKCWRASCEDPMLRCPLSFEDSSRGLMSSVKPRKITSSYGKMNVIRTMPSGFRAKQLLIARQMHARWEQRPWWTKRKLLLKRLEYHFRLFLLVCYLLLC